MYVKYLMAAFVVFALSMMAQFTAYFFNALAEFDLGAGREGSLIHGTVLSRSSF